MTQLYCLISEAGYKRDSFKILCARDLNVLISDKTLDEIYLSIKQFSLCVSFGEARYKILDGIWCPQDGIHIHVLVHTDTQIHLAAGKAELTVQTFSCTPEMSFGIEILDPSGWRYISDNRGYADISYLTIYSKLLWLWCSSWTIKEFWGNLLIAASLVLETRNLCILW